MGQSGNNSKKEHVGEPRESSAVKKPSVRQVWVAKSVEKLQSQKQVETIKKSAPVESTEDSPQPVQNVQLAESVASSSNAFGSVWVERSKTPTEVPRRPQIDSVEELPDDGPPSFSSSEPGESGSESSSEESEVRRGKLKVYRIPKHLKELFEMGMVPEVLTMPLAPSIYADYFAALLYAEDFYIEKWNGFMLYKKTLQLDEQQRKKELKKKRKMLNSNQKAEKMYITFEITDIPLKRPYLLSRDFVFVRCSGKKSEPFEGRFVRVINKTCLRVKFGDDFVSQYSPLHKYDVKFSFNRICLKRSHQAVEAAISPAFQHILFPSPSVAAQSPATPPAQDSDDDQLSIVHKMLSLRGTPYLIKGRPPVVTTAIVESVLEIYRDSPSCRILVTSPGNRTCDTITKSLNLVIPDTKIYRANAIFREVGEVLDDVLPLCSYDGECFTLVELADLRTFKVIISTFSTSFRLHSSGIPAGHFTHIFLLDASSATEPETMVPLANLAGHETSIVVAGSSKRHPNRVRSDIARKNGLRSSYFHRLLTSEPYSSNHPAFVLQLDWAPPKSGWVKVNFGGVIKQEAPMVGSASQKTQRMGGYGYIIRDEAARVLCARGFWFAGDSVHIAKLEAARRGLEEASKVIRANRIWLEGDSAKVIDWIITGNANVGNATRLLGYIIQWRRDLDGFEVSHAARVANRPAYWMANWGSQGHEERLTKRSMPGELTSLVEEDKTGCFFSREA